MVIIDIILTVIPVGFILALLPTLLSDTRPEIHNRTLVVYMGLLLLQGSVFIYLDFLLSGALTFVNAGVWYLLWRKTLQTDQMRMQARSL